MIKKSGAKVSIRMDVVHDCPLFETGRRSEHDTTPFFRKRSNKNCFSVTLATAVAVAVVAAAAAGWVCAHYDMNFTASSKKEGTSPSSPPLSTPPPPPYHALRDLLAEVGERYVRHVARTLRNTRLFAVNNDDEDVKFRQCGG